MVLQLLDQQRLVRLLQHPLDQIQRDELRLVVLGNDNVCQKILLDDEIVDETNEVETKEGEINEDEINEDETNEVETKEEVMINVQMV